MRLFLVPVPENFISDAYGIRKNRRRKPAPENGVDLWRWSVCHRYYILRAVWYFERRSNIASARQSCYVQCSNDTVAYCPKSIAHVSP